MSTFSPELSIWVCLRCRPYCPYDASSLYKFKRSTQSRCEVQVWSGPQSCVWHAHLLFSTTPVLRNSLTRTHLRLGHLVFLFWSSSTFHPLTQDVSIRTKRSAYQKKGILVRAYVRVYSLYWHFVDEREFTIQHKYVELTGTKTAQTVWI